MDHALRPEIAVDFKENVLRVAFQKDAAFPHDLGPALDYRDHDLIDNERFRFDVQTLDHLHQQRWMSAMLEVPGVKGKVGYQESVGLVRSRSCFPDQKPPRVAAIGVGEAKRVWE